MLTVAVVSRDYPCIKLGRLSKTAFELVISRDFQRLLKLIIFANLMRCTGTPTGVGLVIMSHAPSQGRLQAYPRTQVAFDRSQGGQEMTS